MKDVDGTGMALGVSALLAALSMWGQYGDQSDGSFARGSLGNTKDAPYPFADKEVQYARLTDGQLYGAADDAWKAVQASSGWNEPAEGWYRDDLATIRLTLRRRGLPAWTP